MDQQDKKKNQPQEPEIPEKEPPKGKVLSSDYRELFQALDEKERRQREKVEETPKESKNSSEGKKEPHRRADPAAAVKAAVKAAQEGLDLLQENPEEESAAKAQGDENAEETAVMEETPQFRARGTHRAPSLFIGIIVLLLALTGVGYLATTVGTQVYRMVTDDSRERGYDEFLRPLVMQDPEPFASQEEADGQMVLSASLWKALEDNSASYTDYDDSGRTLVPLVDVSDACHALFGPDAQLQLTNLNTDTFFTFDEETNMFHVTPYSTQSSFIPWTESIRTEDGNTVLRVGYVAPTDSWREESGTGEEEPEPVKYMEYVLAQNGDQEYVKEVREPEEGSAPSSSKQ